MGRGGLGLRLHPLHSPVQTEVREPILHDDHHMADREEEGGYLQGLWEQRNRAAGQQGSRAAGQDCGTLSLFLCVQHCGWFPYRPGLNVAG